MSEAFMRDIDQYLRKMRRTRSRARALVADRTVLGIAPTGFPYVQRISRRTKCVMRCTCSYDLSPPCQLHDD